MDGIRFNGYHSYTDKGLTIAKGGREIGYPSKEKKKVKPPFSNYEIDFSRLYGAETYSTRQLSYSFNLMEISKVNLSYLVTDITNWIMNSNGKQPLFDDGIPGYYFLAEAESEPSFKENTSDGILTIEFVAQPFRIKTATEGSPFWDDYTILDRYQETSFDIGGSKTVVIYNDGTPDAVPIVIASSQMTVLLNGSTFTVPTGTSSSVGLYLSTGSNTLLITGTGSIEISFHKELI